MVKRKIGLINLLIIIVSILSCNTSALQHHRHNGHYKTKGIRFMPDRQLNNLI